MAPSGGICVQCGERGVPNGLCDSCRPELASELGIPEGANVWSGLLPGEQLNKAMDDYTVMFLGVSADAPGAESQPLFELSLGSGVAYVQIWRQWIFRRGTAAHIEQTWRPDGTTATSLAIGIEDLISASTSRRERNDGILRGLAVRTVKLLDRLVDEITQGHGELEGVYQRMLDDTLVTLAYLLAGRPHRFRFIFGGVDNRPEPTKERPLKLI